MPGRRRWAWWTLAGVVCMSCGTDVGFLVPPGNPDAVIAAIEQQFESFHDFSDSDGNAPQARLLEASDGMLFGTTTGTSDSDRGTIFLLNRALAPMVLHDFSPSQSLATSPTTGSPTYAPSTLALQRDGTIVGVSQAGGESSGGALFQLTETGDLDILHHFSGGDGANPIQAIASDNGTIFGVTAVGGPNGGRGTLFAFDGEEIVVLHSFLDPDGINPTGLVQAQDGILYGTTRAGGEFDLGTIFQFDPATGFALLHSFRGADGAVPIAGLTAAPDGVLYGTTSRGGDRDQGIVFQISPGNPIAVLHEFKGSDGATPAASVTLASDGSLYGTTEFGGRGNSGTIFRLAPDGTFASLYQFSSRDGAFPKAALLETRDRWLYGTTSSGGASGRGTLFRLPLPNLTSTPTVTPARTGSSVAFPFSSSGTHPNFSGDSAALPEAEPQPLPDRPHPPQLQNTETDLEASAESGDTFNLDKLTSASESANPTEHPRAFAPHSLSNSTARFLETISSAESLEGEDSQALEFSTAEVHHSP